MASSIAVEQLRYADAIFEIKDDHEIWEHQDLASLMRSASFPGHVEVEADVFETCVGSSANDDAGESPSNDSLTTKSGDALATSSSMIRSISYFLDAAGYATLFWPAVVAVIVAIIEMSRE